MYKENLVTRWYSGWLDSLLSIRKPRTCECLIYLFNSSFSLQLAKQLTQITPFSNFCNMA